MKTLLIPTDFNLESLNAVSRLVETLQPQKLNIVMVHLLGITDCMGELELLSRRSAEYRLISADFYNTCTRLKQQHADVIEKIDVTFFYGYTMAAFRNFLEAQQVDAIVKLDDYDYQLLTEKSINPNNLIHRSGKEIIWASTKPVQQTVPTQTENAPAELQVLELEEERV
ncbi:MAG: hypothetical protein V4619_09855 [Bacteroidota bacterium]